MDTKADRIARKLRPVFFWACVVALPVFLITYLKMIVAFYHENGAALFLLACGAHVIVWIAAAMLHDHQQENR